MANKQCLISSKGELVSDHLKVVVDFDVCESNAVCMAIAPEVFEVRDDDFLYVLNETPGVELAEKVREAAQQCPKQAITLEEVQRIESPADS